MNSENQSSHWETFRKLCYKLGVAHQRSIRAQNNRVVANDCLLRDLKQLALNINADEAAISNSNDVLKTVINSFNLLKQNFACEVEVKREELDILKQLKSYLKEPPTT